MVDRNQFIDFLRGFAIAVMILTHTTVFFPHDKIAFTLWNYSQFAVPVFLFCSSYLFLLKNVEKPVSFFSYLKKRALRLLVPYYIFLLCYVVCVFVVSPHVINAKYIIQSIFLIGGVDINWLVLLFLYITLLLPFFAWSYKKSKLFFWIFFTLSLGSTIFLLFQHVTTAYKFTMWFPWATMLYFTFLYIKYETNKKVLKSLFFVSLLIFIITYLIQSNLHHDLVLRNNKYPPNLFYITYGTSVILFLSLFSNFILKSKVVINIFNFFSKYSYSIFFVHYIVLTVLVVFIKQLQFNWVTLFLSVLISTVVLQKLYNWVTHKVD